jgi:Methylase involved in ubiquinone/menaquinone biosynthesis
MNITNPAFDYEKPGIDYASYRQTDPRIAAHVHAALGNTNTILNIGAGAGSYEPAGKYVVAVEPSAAMRAQRMAKGIAPAIIGKADSLPFDDNSFDACMAMVTIHHWPDIRAGLQEMRRVAKDRVVVMTFDPAALDSFWNVHYFPNVIAAEKKRYPSIEYITESLGGNCEVLEVPIPLDCVDGFQEAFYGRPEAFLSGAVRRAQSAWGFVDDATAQAYVQHLSDELQSGEWDRKYGQYRSMPEAVFSLRLVVGYQ